jgi:hypothetical protein
MIKYVCSECGGDSVEMRVTKTWNVTYQMWEEEDAFYSGSYCADCGGVDFPLEPVEVTDEENNNSR